MRVYLTIDVEAHRSIREISGEGQNSLGAILTILRESDCLATFFVDVCEVAKWGLEFMQATCKQIAADGHRVELHVHPHHATGDNDRWLLSEYTREEQLIILTKAIADFELLTGARPLAFRAGGFGANADTLQILQCHGIICDSSYLWRRPGCHLEPDNRVGPSNYLGLREIPLTPAVLLGTINYPFRVSSLDFNWIPLFVLKRLYIELERQGVQTVVFLMHSSSMYVRTGKMSYWYRKRNERKLRELIQFLRGRRAQFAAISDPVPNGALEEGSSMLPSPVVLDGVMTQYIVLIYQAVIGAGISQKFLVFALINIVGLTVLVIFVLSLIVRNF